MGCFVFVVIRDISVNLLYLRLYVLSELTLFCESHLKLILSPLFVLMTGRFPSHWMLSKANCEYVSDFRWWSKSS